MKKFILLAVALFVAACLIPSLAHATNSVSVEDSVDDFQHQRLQHLASLMEMDAMTEAAGSDDDEDKPAASSTGAAAPAAAAPTPAPAAAPAAKPASDDDDEDSVKKPVARISPKFQGTNRADLVALYRFESSRNPGRGLGGAGRNLKVFGNGIKVVKGSDAKVGKGSLFIPQRKVNATVDPANPYQNSFLAKYADGTPIPNLPKGGDSFTVAGWYKVVTDQNSGRFGIVSFGSNDTNSANKFKASAHGRVIHSFHSGTTLKSNGTADLISSWHHGAVTYNRDTQVQSIYVDGVLSATRVLAKAPSVASPGQFFLGVSSNTAQSEQFAGYLDDVAIFKVALNPDEIKNIQNGNFDSYLDLFSLRSCSTRVGRRQHGAGFVLGGDDETIDLDNSTQKYGFNTKNAFECAIKCAQTIDCKQSVFIAAPSAVPAATTNSTASFKVSGACYLQNHAYKTYETDKTATSTRCSSPSRRLRKSSIILKSSPNAAEQATKRAIRVAAEKKARAEFEAKLTVAERKLRARQARAKAEAEKKIKEEEARKKVEVEADKRAEKRLHAKLASEYSKKLAKLQTALNKKAAALAATKKKDAADRAQAKKVAAELKRVAALAEKLAIKKAEDSKKLALAAQIKMEADTQAGRILIEAKKKVKATRHQAKLKYRRELRKKLEAAKLAKKRAKKSEASLTKSQRAELAKLKAAADKAAKALKALKTKATRKAKARARKERIQAKKIVAAEKKKQAKTQKSAYKPAPGAKSTAKAAAPTVKAANPTMKF